MSFRKLEDYYEINRDIGHGAYGKVFLGKEKKNWEKNSN